MQTAPQKKRTTTNWLKLGGLSLLLLLTSVPAWADVDLVMTAVSTPATSLLIGSSSATVSTTVRNQGATATTAAYIPVGIYLSTDATITTADRLIGANVVFSLAAGASSSVNATLYIPADLAPGTYYLGAIADYAGNMQPETIETNNALAGGTIVVGALTAPDAPTIVSATGGNAQATVTFNAPASNGGSPITGYTATSSPGGITGTCVVSPCTVSGLTNGTAYTFTVTATNALGTSVASAASNSVVVNPAIAQAYYIHTDQLDTPRQITNSNGNVVWQWDNSDPFGNNMANENPSGAGTFNFNLRFPGQYYDRETNLHYNVNRDYDPASGRYIQSDPIGLAGGINTYSYVNGNPLSYTDPLGLFNYAKGAVAIANTIAAGISIGAGAASIVGGVGVAPTGVGVPVSAGAIAFGAWRINAGIAAARRAKQQWNEAKKECSSDASWDNALGLLPFGQNFDDSHESFDEYGQGLLNQPTSVKIIDILTYGPFGR